MLPARHIDNLVVVFAADHRSFDENPSGRGDGNVGGTSVAALLGGRGQLPLHNGGGPREGFIDPGRLSAVSGGDTAQTGTDTGGVTEAGTGEEAAQVGFDDADRSPVEQDVMCVGSKADHQAAAVEMHGIARQWRCADARFPLVRQRGEGVTAGHVHDIVGRRAGARARDNCGVCLRLEESEENNLTDDAVLKNFSAPVSNHYLPGTSFLHQLSAEIKIGIIFVLAITILIMSDVRFCVGLFLSLFLVIVLSNTSVAFMFSRVRKYAVLIMIAFLFPLFLNSGSHVLFTLVSFKITHEGLTAGGLYAFRILFLILTSALIMRTTSPDEMTHGLAKVLSPVRYLGISEKNISRTLSLSWNAIPVIWETARQTIRDADLTKAKNLRNLIPLLSNLIAVLYLTTEPENKFWKNACASQKKDSDRQNPADRS